MLTSEIEDYRPVALGKIRQFCKEFFGFFELLEQSFLFEHFQKSICSGIFSSVVSCGLYLCMHLYLKGSPQHKLLWIFSAFFGVAVPKYPHEIIRDKI